MDVMQNTEIKNSTEEQKYCLKKKKVCQGFSASEDEFPLCIPSDCWCGPRFPVRKALHESYQPKVVD